MSPATPQVEIGEEEEVVAGHQQVQKAVHIGTIRKDEGLNAPRSSPTGEQRQPIHTAEEAIKR